MHPLGRAVRARANALAVAATVTVALVLRVQHFLVAGNAPGWNGAVLVYGNIAANLIHSHGYVMTTPPRLTSLAGWASTIMPAAQAWHLSGGPRLIPPAYFMPGYPLLLAGIWWVTGTLSYTSTQVPALILDAATMTLGPWLLLRSLGRRWVGVAAALLCAVAPPLIDVSTRIMPDGLATDLVLWGLVAAVALRRQLLLAMIVSGMCFGAALWLQGDMVVAAPLLAGAVLIAAPASWGTCLRAVGALAGVVALWNLGLSLFLGHIYGGFHVTRPGLGALLGQGLEENKPYPVHALSGLEASQHALLTRHHLAWGSWTGDNLLLHQALRTIEHHPLMYAAMVLHRAGSIAGLGLLGLSFPWYVLVLLGLAGLWSLRNCPYMALVLLGAWVGRVVPFSLIHVEGRYIVLLVPLDAVVMACGAAALWEAVARFLALHRTRRLRPATATGWAAPRDAGGPVE